MIRLFAFDGILIALTSLAPGVIAWWTGRRLAASPDDPALPELLLARQQRLAQFVAGALAVAIVLGGASAYWAVPVIAVGVAIGSFPLRRALRIESSNLVSYLWRATKSIIGGLGFWILLAWTPDIVISTDARYRFAALGLLAVLLLWEHWYPRIWLRLHDATPLTDQGELGGRLSAIIARAGIPAPALYRIGGPDARFMNALAFPSVRTPRIGLGNALLELLEPDEVAAIYAHELAHIEHFSPRVVRRLQAWTRLLIALSIAAPLLAALVSNGVAYWVAMLWPLVVLGYLVLRARKSQQHETESDLRAAALCGDPEAVARALIKLHVHAFMPRRWPIDFERSASHPSLARRIQALRGGGPAAVAALGAPTVLPTSREGSVVVFDDARAYWFDGVPEGTPPALDTLRSAASSARSVAWPDLIELRVTTQGTERALRATHKNGDSWSVPLAATHIAETQKALDVVDVRLRRELGKRPPVALQLVPVLALAGMILSGQIGVLLIPVTLAVFRPSTAALAALGTMALARGALALALNEEPVFGAAPIGIPALLAVGVLGLWMAWHRIRKEGKRDGGHLTSWALIGMAIVLVLSIGYALPHMPLAEILRFPLVPALATTLLGIGAVALTASQGARVAGLAVAVAGLALGVARVGGSRLADAGGRLSHVTRRAIPVGEVDLGASASGLELSPDGTRYAIVRQVERGRSPGREAVMPRYVIGVVNGGRREVEAMQVAFVDSVQVLLLRFVGPHYELRLEHADSGTVRWTQEVPEIYEPHLSVSGDNGQWMLVGEETASDSMLIMAGDAVAPVTRSRRAAPADSMGAFEPIVFDGGSTLIVPVFQTSSKLPMPLIMFGMYWPHVRMARITPGGVQQLGEMDGYPQCGSAARGRALCFVRHRRGASVWSVAADGALRREARLDVRDPIVAAPGPGPAMTVTSGGNRVTLVDVAQERVIDVALSAGPGVITEARSFGGRLAMIRHEERTARLVLYRIE